MLHSRIASPRAIDSWHEEGLHFFVFALTVANGAAVNPSDPPVAVFTMHPDEPAPLSVVVVTPSANGEEAQVVDMRQPDSAYTAAFSGTASVAASSDTSAENGQAVEESPREDEAVAVQADPPPAADASLLTPLRESQEYQAIENRVATAAPGDSWQEEGLHFFVFQLLPMDESSANGHEPPVAVFSMDPVQRALISAVVVSSPTDNDEPAVINLRDPCIAEAPPETIDAADRSLIASSTE